ncbi:hypothetical protein ONS95_007157 [Cadophora gregata]|uniref:uncharacterized protein n=1 Tax=Cadophora gregata TaxID=51156 RepID=UPI0026DADF25|nr:uncharacterized protein ONS95_007157 [Cadophora gregata]KAK0100706.1 hypothetical protein ONS95_007157 [Cadophora gregata]KAK0117297.1 hypothetical protein ONS96_013130 [Cadophora gregata f. sp. sojae]
MDKTVSSKSKVRDTLASSMLSTAVREKSVSADIQVPLSSNSTADSQQASTSTSAGPIEAFPLFPKLPLDIRFMIYDLLISNPRVIKIRSGSLFRGRRGTYMLAVKGSAPPIIQVNTEARTLGRKKLDQPFIQTLGCCVYVNFETDLLYFDEPMDTLFWNMADKLTTEDDEQALLQILSSKLRYCVFRMPTTWPPQHLDKFKSLQIMILDTPSRVVHKDYIHSLRNAKARINKLMCDQKEASGGKNTLAVRLTSARFIKNTLSPNWSTIVDLEILEQHCANLRR